ncbi:HD domain-containing protein [Hoeflea sp. EC-HK425]|uniref:HD-GYP domain-containing protein n=1 Tax=Hoeflea sp. EC-HK425 TaxID=2038388 RepID=UPI001251D042|nr:HD domain-containing protein [Hoeflea sp. EC-HK425]VVT28960.1 3'3'-cGAMP-specific phosphodiesterase 3 [Hoeflea sp. EC-HK425]
MSKSLYLTRTAEPRPQAFRRAELLGALSYALDLTEGQPQGHCIRCCWIGTRIGEALNLPAEMLSDLYYTLLLKDLGCSSNAARICELYLADDISFKRDFKTIDGSLSSALRFVFKKTGLESGLSERIRAIVNILQNGGEISRSLIETRCHRGADIAARMRFSEAVQSGILSLDEHWDGSGKPEGLKAQEIPVISNIALLAQVIDIFHTENGAAAALREAGARAGDWFDPALVDAFLQAQSDPEFWPALVAPDIEARVFAMQPGLTSEVVDEDYLDDVAAAFSDVVDAKSPFTADHSNRVTLYTDMIAEELGLDAAHRRWLRRAALLHDLGKLGVSNQVLDKPGKPDEAEWASIRRHPVQSEAILARVAAFTDIAPVAAAHHERLDGKGYPYGLAGDEICLEARILTVADVFDALSAERPYRAAMPISKALSILDADAGSAFDPACIAALKSGLAKLNAEMAA